MWNSTIDYRLYTAFLLQIIECGMKYAFYLLQGDGRRKEHSAIRQSLMGIETIAGKITGKQGC